jgi:hypothetical protein
MVTAILGLGLGIAKAARGFKTSADSAKAARQAEQNAAKLFADTRRRANVNVYEELSVPFDAYERGFEAQLQSDIQSLSALQEADSRALAGGVGRIGAQQEAEAEKMRIAMADEMFNLDKLKADAKENIKQQNIALNIAEARMEDQKRREALQMRQQGLQQGIAGLGESMVAASGFFPEKMKQTLGADQEPPVDIVGDPNKAMTSLGTPVETTPANQNLSMPFTVQSDFQGSGLMSSGGVATVPTLGTAGLTMFPGVTALQPPPMYNQAITGPGRIYDRRGRVVDFFNK